ncbi:hypothetical protein KAU33_07670, partial [Candidatus Dependentiae bacterium]|nr:hypothetical protein [Candidatus Dependentiae bacterium]
MVRKFYKIKGSVLIYVLIAIMIVAILITSLMVSISIRNKLNIPKRKEIQMLYTAESGNIFLINKLVKGNKITFNEEINLRDKLSESFPELCSDYLIQGNLHLQPGLFQVSTKVSNNFMEKTVSQKFGINIYDNFTYAVYSNNRLNPLIISGKESEIIGGASSPISIYEIEDAKV